MWYTCVYVCAYVLHVYELTDMGVHGHTGLTWELCRAPALLSVCESVPVNVPAIYSYLQAQLSALAAV